MSVAKIAVDIILIAILVGGVGFSIFFATNTSTYDTTTLLVWGFIAVIAVAGIILQLLKDVGVKINM